MSTVAAPSAINVYKELMSTPDWASFEEACEHNSDMKSWSNNVNTLAEEALKSYKGGEGLSIHSLKPFTTYALLSNETIVSGISTLKEGIMKDEGASKEMKEAQGEMVDALGDQYIKMSSHMMDFLSEMERFVTRARDSHGYVALVIQQYFEKETDKRDAEHYRLIVEKLEKLKSADNVYEHSAEGLLEKAIGLKKQHEEMLQKLKDEISKLHDAEQRAKASFWTWKHITATIGTVLAVGITIATCAVACLLAPVTALAIASISMPVGVAAGAVALSLWYEVDKQTTKDRLEEDKSMSKDTRAVIVELGDIKSSIQSVITAIESLLYKPDSAMDLKHKEDIDLTMKGIEKKLGNFLDTINVLDGDVKTCKMDVRKARKEVYT